MKLERELEQLRAENFELKTRGMAGGDGTEDGRSMRGSTASRIYEGRVRELEAEVEKRNNIMDDLKRLLQDSVIREQNWLRERDRLQHEVGFPKRFQEMFVA